ncbi:MAG: phosphoglycolate phosphatase [Pseudomonadota bacterium]
MKNSHIEAIFFDLDGTLVDSAGDLATSVNHGLSLIDQGPLAETTIRGFIGNGADRLIHRAITGDYEGEADEALYAPVRRAFLDHYASNVCRLSTLYPNVDDLLVKLSEHTYKLACITNKPQAFTQPLLANLNIDKYFKLVLSGDSLSRKKPAPDQLLFAVEQFGVAVSNCLMVGDTNTDMCAALNCEMPGIFVTYGYGEAKDLDPRFSGPKIDDIAALHRYL